MILLLWLLAAAVTQPYHDRTFESRIFAQPRHYRLFLPAGYADSTRRYPVIYYFHGHSDRYTLERYDEGQDTVPAIARFVAAHPVIVVAVDGYVADHYTGFYGGTPYDISREGGRYDSANISANSPPTSTPPSAPSPPAATAPPQASAWAAT